MSGPEQVRFLAALEDFRRARRRAVIQEILGRMTGRPVDLLPYEEVRTRLRTEGATDRGLQEVPLEAIVGSVGRYTDFTRAFLPRHDDDAERWAGLKVKLEEQGLRSPVRVYQVGQAYFVADGNHRVSIARQLGASHIPAYVTQIHTRVPLSPEDRPDDIIRKAELADFLERTRLDHTRHEADLSVTIPGQYRTLEQEICAHQAGMAGRQVSLPQAAADWYDHTYRPVVEMIRRSGILRDFPGRTETDLYIWIARHRAELEQALGWPVRPQEVAEHLVERASPRARHVLARVADRVRELLTPLSLRPGPPVGHWRQEHVEPRRDERLFGDILVALDGRETGWHALEGALVVAQREGGRLYGLHVTHQEDRETLARIKARFERRCREAGISGRLVVAAGPVARRIEERARWTDLVVLSLSYPPGPRPLSRLASGLSALLRSSPRPVLAIPPTAPLSMQRALLAYDGSPKADEALFVATYLAGRWATPLTVLTVSDREETAAHILERARRYLEEHGVTARLLHRPGPVASAIERTAQEEDRDLLILGSYGRRPLLEVLLGSTVDDLLYRGRLALLLCR